MNLEHLELERQQILERSRALRDEREALLAYIQPLEERLKQINAEIIAIERPRLSEIDNELGLWARIKSGLSMLGS